MAGKDIAYFYELIDRLAKDHDLTDEEFKDLILSEELPEPALFEDDTSASCGLNEYLEQLPSEDREIVKRRYYHEQKVSEIAKDMGMDKKKVENRLFRSKQKLKDMLGDMNAC